MNAALKQLRDDDFSMDLARIKEFAFDGTHAGSPENTQWFLTAVVDLLSRAQDEVAKEKILTIAAVALPEYSAEDLCARTKLKLSGEGNSV